MPDPNNLPYQTLAEYEVAFEKEKKVQALQAYSKDPQRHQSRPVDLENDYAKLMRFL